MSEQNQSFMLKKQVPTSFWIVFSIICIQFPVLAQDRIIELSQNEMKVITPNVEQIELFAYPLDLLPHAHQIQTIELDDQSIITEFTIHAEFCSGFILSIKPNRLQQLIIFDSARNYIAELTNAMTTSDCIMSSTIHLRCVSNSSLSVEELLNNLMIYGIPRQSEGPSGFGESWTCHVNINCPSAVGFNQKLKQGVARIFMVLKEGVGSCTGSLLNDTGASFGKYFLTAFHCQKGYTPYYDQWKFYFNYESTDCTNPPNEPTLFSITGCTLKSGYDPTDHLLLQLNKIPANTPVIALGWERDSTYLPKGLGMIHHPKGDIKKFAKDNDVPTLQNQQLSLNGGANKYPPFNHIRIQHDIGTSEGGSSGSPILDTMGRVLGSLTGGVSSCTGNFLYYARFHKMWIGGGTPETRLSDWLDPANLNVSKLNWKDPNIPTTLLISGTIEPVKSSLNIPNLQIHLAGNTLTKDTSSQNDTYQVEVPNNWTGTIKMDYTIGPIQGVNAFDLLVIQKHLLGIQLFTHPWQFKLADANKSNTVSIADVVLLRKLIIHALDNFPDGKTWLIEPKDGQSSIGPLTGPISKNFLAGKMGDVDGF